MSHKWISVSLIVLGLALLLLPASPARAQEPTPENDANCVACHTHEYYLNDNGKWFCLCEAPMHCVYCHAVAPTASSRKKPMKDWCFTQPATRRSAARPATPPIMYPVW